MTGEPSPYYEIRVQGRLDSHWAARFDGMRLEHRDDDTVLVGPVTDQSALHGTLATIRDLGLCLISVGRLDPPPPDQVMLGPARPAQS